MKNHFNILLLCCFSLNSASQNYDYTWIQINPSQDTTSNDPLDPPYPSAFLTFKTSPPTINYFNGNLIGLRAEMLMCDFQGSPLFYSNGYNIYHMNGVLMPNGDSLLPIAFQKDYPLGYPYPLAMMGLPRPGHDGDFYILQHYMENNWTYAPKMLLSMVTDVSDSVSGFVSFKNKVIFEGQNSNRIDFFNVTKHANGRDWWLVFSNIDTEAHTKTFYSYCLTPDSTYLAQSSMFVGYEPVPDNPWEIYTLQKVFSPDGKYFISHDPINGIRIHTFDRCTGALGPLYSIPFQMGHWYAGGVAVSPNSQFLYVSNAENVFQYDLTATDIVSTKDTVAVYDGYVDSSDGIPTLFGYPELGPDGKIYYFIQGHDWVHVISQPNIQGDACQFIQRAFKMPVRAGTHPFYPNYRLGPIDGTACDSLGINNEPLADFWWFTDSTLSVRFSDNSSYEPTHWAWEFGDGGISQDTSPVHTFPGNATYHVCLTASNQYAENTICKDVTLGSMATLAPEKPNRIRVFPNPTAGLVRWESQGLGNEAVRVYNLLGQLVLEKKVVENQLDLTGFSAGVYLLEFRVGDERFWEKVVKR